MVITFQKELCQELLLFKWDGWCDVRHYIKLHIRFKTWTPCFKKYGPKIRIKEHHIEKTHILFEKYGPFLLIVGYFIPGVRHLTAYFAGMSNLTLWRFCLYAYGGAFIWISVFIGLGWKLGEKWRFVEYSLHHYGIWILSISVVVTGVVWFYIKKRKPRVAVFS